MRVVSSVLLVAVQRMPRSRLRTAAGPQEETNLRALKLRGHSESATSSGGGGATPGLSLRGGSGQGRDGRRARSGSGTSAPPALHHSSYLCVEIAIDVRNACHGMSCRHVGGRR